VKRRSANATQATPLMVTAAPAMMRAVMWSPKSNPARVNEITGVASKYGVVRDTS
jgi:hypothetical protein